MALRRDAKVELLKSTPLFSGCSKSELRELAKTADELDLREGTVLTREGRPGREFFVLIEGTVAGDEEGQEDRRPRPRRLARRDRADHGQPAHRNGHGDLVRRRSRDHRSAVPLRRRDDAVDRAEGARARGRAARAATRTADEFVERGDAVTPQEIAASPRSARTSAKKSASGLTRYSGPRASVRSPSEVSSAT